MSLGMSANSVTLGSSQTTSKDGIGSTASSTLGSSQMTESATTHDKEKSTEERNVPMSLCFAVSTYKALYFASDSRSSIGEWGETLPGYFLKYYSDSDDYVKLCCIKLFDTDVVMFSTGSNRFKGNKTFVECLSQVSLNNITSVQDGIKRIEEHFTKQETAGVDISFFYFVDGTKYVYCSYFSGNENQPPFDEHKLPPKNSSESGTRYFSGADWGQALAKRMIFHSDFSDEKAVCAINQLYEKVRLVSPYFDNTIGGTIRIAKLTPDGFTWLQGEPKSE